MNYHGSMNSNFEIQKLINSAPWPIPPEAKIRQESKKGYWQMKFTWRQHGWRYEARFHNKTPQAKIITYPSWRLDRIHPGKGYGPNHAVKIEEARVGKKWLKISFVRYCAWRVNRGLASQKEIAVIKQAHVRAKNYR